MFEFFFKYPPSVFSKGTLVLLGSWPQWLLPVFILAAAGTLGWLLWRNRSRISSSIQGARTVVVWLLQTALVALLLLLLWEPALSVASLKPEQNIVAVVVDNSRSMGLRDGRGSTRLDDASRLVEKTLKPGLNSRFQVRLYGLGTELTRIPQTDKLTASDPSTHIAGGLRQLATDAATLPIGAVVLLSDGQDNSGGVDLDTMSELRRRHLPVSTIGFGKETIDQDLELEGVEVPAKALADARLEAQVSIRQHGFSGKRAMLVVSEPGKILASREVLLKGEGQQIESIEFNAGKAGVKNLDVRVDALPGEENRENNRLTRVLAVEGARRRLLYVEGEPRWDYKFIRRAVEDDPAIEIVSILRTTQNKIYTQGVATPDELVGGFPGVEKLFDFQGLILGSVEAGYFTALQQELIKQFADRRGGGVLFLGGRASLADGGYNSAPFAELLPVNLPKHANTFHRDMAEAAVTDSGRQSLICRIEDDPKKSAEHWKILPYLANYQDAGTAKAGAVVLAEMKAAGKTLPLLVTENYGRGRSAVFATGGSWRWRMQQPKEDTSQQTFWRQLLRWDVSATPSRVVASTPNANLEDDGHIQLRAEVRDTTYLPTSDAVVEAHITNPDGSAEVVALRPEPLTQGTYSAEWNAPKAGSYATEVVASRGGTELGRDVLMFRRNDGVAESFHHEQNRELLERLAAETGGHYYKPSEARRLLEEISYSEAGVSSRETRDLWNMPIVFLAVLALRSAEWLLRRRWGVV